jgi:hypothetical protein
LSRELLLRCITAFFLLPLAFCFIACELYEIGPDEDEIVLEAYLIAGRRFDSITLRRSLSIRELRELGLKDLQAQSSGADPGSLSGATVKLFDSARVYELVEDSARERGSYKLRAQDSLLIGYNTPYRILVQAFGKQATARTTTPAQVKAKLAEPRERIVFPYDTIKLALTKPLLSHGYLIIAKSEIDQPPNPLFTGKSYLITTDSLVTLSWTIFSRLGKVKLYIYAFDKNYFDYFRTQRSADPSQPLVQPISPVNGGIGLFASASVDSLNIAIETSVTR